jgi:hypothetical protein
VPAAEMPMLMRQACLFPTLRAELKLVAGE